MEQNKKKNIALLITAAFLFVALFDGWSYGFFTLLRFVVFTSSAYVAWIVYKAKNEKLVWISCCAVQSIYRHSSQPRNLECY